MKLSKAYNKNFSQKEQELKIDKKFQNATIEKLFFFTKEIILKKKLNYFYSQLTEEEFNYLLDNYNKDKESLVLSLNIIRFLIDKNIINYNMSEILIVEENQIDNFLEDKKISIKNFLKKDNKLTLMIDTSILFIFLINKKTINKFSFLIITKEKNMILYKRGYKKFIFGINLKK